MLTASLRAFGVDPAHLKDDPTLRDQVRNFGLIHRYITQSGRTFEDIAKEARARASIQTFPSVLNATR